MKKEVLTAIVGICLLGMIGVFGGYEHGRLTALTTSIAEIICIICGLASAYFLMRGEES